MDLVQEILSHGAHKAALVNVSDIPFDEGLRAYCEANVCGNFGQNYGCPPHVGSVKKVLEKARDFENALVYQTVFPLEDSFDLEGMEEAGKKHVAVANDMEGAVKSLYPRYLKLTAGGCSVCPACAKKENAPCRFPDKAFSSLEAYCINVSSLSKLCGMNYINGPNTVTYFGAFLF